MNHSDSFDLIVSEWLHADAEHRVPEHLDAVLRRTRTERQRPAWSSLERWLPVQSTFNLRLVPLPRAAWLLVVVGLLIAIAAAALWMGSRQRLPAPFGPAANGAIVYSNGGDIYLADPGAESRLVVGGQSIDVGPTYSYDGTRIAFLRQVSDRMLQYMVMDADGTHVSALTKEPLRDPDNWDWSPDGTQLVVMHGPAGHRVLSILRTDGSGAIRQLDLGGLEPDTPAWRPPDGHEIVFRGVGDDGRSTALYSIRPDGTGLRALTPVLARSDGSYVGPLLSSDGGAVAYTNFVEPDDSADGSGGHGHILDLATGTDRRIGADPAAANEIWPVFSPDGRQVVYRRYGTDVPMRLMIASADGTGSARQVGPPQDADLDPIVAISPDGAKLFVAGRGLASWQLIGIADGSVQHGASVDDWAHWQRVAAAE